MTNASSALRRNRSQYRPSAGDVAVITGAAGGIGLALASKFARQGLRVFMTDVDAESLDIAANRLGQPSMPADVRLIEEVEAVRDAAFNQFGRIDLVCNNAAIDVSGDLKDLAVEDWRWVIEVNLYGVINGVHVFQPTLKANPGGGWIMNTGSRAGLVTTWASAPYAVSKYGLTGLSEVMLAEFALNAPTVGVSVLIPTATRTRLSSKAHSRPRDVQRKVPETDSMQQKADHATSQMAIGLLPDAVAEVAWAGLQRGSFWIFTDPSTVDLVRSRTEEMASDVAD